MTSAIGEASALRRRLEDGATDSCVDDGSARRLKDTEFSGSEVAKPSLKISELVLALQLEVSFGRFLRRSSSSRVSGEELTSSRETCNGKPPLVAVARVPPPSWVPESANKGMVILGKILRSSCQSSFCAKLNDDGHSTWVNGKPWLHNGTFCNFLRPKLSTRTSPVSKCVLGETERLLDGDVTVSEKVGRSENDDVAEENDAEEDITNERGLLSDRDGREVSLGARRGSTCELTGGFEDDDNALSAGGWRN